MLCEKCSGGMYITNIGHCTACGSMTSSGMFTLCASCAEAKNQCASCGKPIDELRNLTSSAATPTTSNQAKMPEALGDDEIVVAP